MTSKSATEGIITNPPERVGGVDSRDRLAAIREGVFPDFNEAFFESGGLHRLSSWIESHAATAPVVPPETRLGSPIARPSKIIWLRG